MPWDMQASGVVATRSSLPYNVTTGTDDNRDTQTAGNAPFCSSRIEPTTVAAVDCADAVAAPEASATATSPTSVGDMRILQVNVK
jgi:hypothetical protein